MQTIKTALKRISIPSEKYWQTQLVVMDQSYRARKMGNNFSPFFWMYGTNSRLSTSDILTQVGEDVEMASGARSVDNEHRVGALLAVEGHLPDRLTKVFGNVSIHTKLGTWC